MDVNTKKIKKNAFRVTKERGLTASRVRVPGGHLDAGYLSMIQDIAQRYGNGSVHMTVRQGFEIPGIRYEDMDKVNELLQPIIEGIGINQPERGKGYSASGTRNISACVGNKVCPYACYDTSGFAFKIEKAVFPDDLHVKVALTGCPNDCAKVRMHDFGIMGMTQPEYRRERCVSCGACVKACPKMIIELRKKWPKNRAVYVSCVSKDKGAVVMKACKAGCIGCGKCVKVCAFDAITVENNLAYIDPQKCKLCRKCVNECPTGAIRLVGMDPLPKAPKAPATPATPAAPKAGAAPKVEN